MLLLPTQMPNLIHHTPLYLQSKPKTESPSPITSQAHTTPLIKTLPRFYYPPKVKPKVNQTTLFPPRDSIACNPYSKHHHHLLLPHSTPATPTIPLLHKTPNLVSCHKLQLPKVIKTHFPTKTNLTARINDNSSKGQKERWERDKEHKRKP